jgi:O-acetylhomoserine (thiol)-lyase
MKGFTSRALHGALAWPDRNGALRFPVYDCAAFSYETAQALEQAFAGRTPTHIYSRITNPTVTDLELRIRELADGLAVIAVASGMAAISNVIMAICETGCNLVTSRHLFGNTISLFEKTLKPWGLETRYVSMLEPESVARAIDRKTRAIFLETITNPQLEVADVKLLGEIAKDHGLPLLLDNTVTTPYLFRSREFGVAVELLSSTKYISGGAAGVGGLIIDNGVYDWSLSPKLAQEASKSGALALVASLRRQVYRNMGACLAPHNASLQSLGLETMALRIDRSCANALGVAEYLYRQPMVRAVSYPGLENSPFHGLAATQFNNRFGGVLTFDLNSREECYRMLDQLRMIKRATNINDNKTLALHPATTIFAEYSDLDRQAMGIRPTMIRLAVGIEDLEDILADLEQAFDAVSPPDRGIATPQGSGMRT